jgi:hypothetical protein
MSTGHGHRGIRLSAREIDELLAHPRMVKELAKDWSLDVGHDLPFLAGYSEDGTRRFIDRHFRAKDAPVGSILIKGKLIDCRPWLVGDPSKKGIFKCGHEGVEKAGITVFGWSYDHAHEVATAAERRILLAILGPGWWVPYSKAIEPFIKTAESESLQKIPKDLDLTPYESKPVNHKLLRHMQAAMRRAA